MMKKNMKWYFLALLSFWMTACADVYKEDGMAWKEEEENTPPGTAYTPEGAYNLNVVYYVPADVDSVYMWHKRLSSLTLHVQKFFLENMKRSGFNKKLGLILNDANPLYIKITYIKSKRMLADMKQKNINEMTQEILDYFIANPAEKTSNHTLVYMPQYEGSFIASGFQNLSNGPVPDHGFAIAGCDAEKFDGKFIDSKKGRAAYLKSLGKVIYELCHAFFLAENGGKETDSRFALLGRIGMINNSLNQLYNYDKYYLDPSKMMLTAVDALWLNQVQVFNDESHEYKNISVIIDDVVIACKDSDVDTVFVRCRFRSSDEILAAVLYNDPWRSSWNDLGVANNTFPATEYMSFNSNPNTRTGGDAVAYSTADFYREGDLYVASFKIPWADLHEKHRPGDMVYDASIKDNPNTPLVEKSTYTPGEIRFSFIGKGGMFPHPAVSVKGEWGSTFRWPYHIERSWNGSYSPAVYFDIPDIMWRYGMIQGE